MTAVACDITGSEIGKSELVSAVGKSRIQISPEKKVIQSGEVLYVNVDLVGENGIIESNDDRKLKVTVDGGELLAFGSANPRTEERFDHGAYTTYYGRALAVVRGTEKNILKITVSGEGLDTEQTKISVKVEERRTIYEN